MHWKRSLTPVLGLALLAGGGLAAVKAMTLSELLSMSSDVVHATITAKSTFRTTTNMHDEEAVYTKLHVQGTSLMSGQAVDTDVVFMGSHSAADGFATSEMPTAQDTRVGNEIVLFFHDHPEELPVAAHVVHNFAEVFRVERAFGLPVLMGKGDGSAFPENVLLSEAHSRVKAAADALKAQGK